MAELELFASYEPEGARRGEIAFELRRAVEADLEELVLIAHERGGGELAGLRSSMRARLALPPERGALFVAQLGGGSREPGRLGAGSLEAGRLAGYGGSAWLEWPPELLAGSLAQRQPEREAGAGPAACAEAEPPHVPAGWYLTGVVVRPHWRRRGIGRALTRARIEAWLATQAGGAPSPLRFVVNSNNRPSIDLHRALGFELETQEVRMTKVLFRGGRGLLYRLERAPS